MSNLILTLGECVRYGILGQSELEKAVDAVLEAKHGPQFRGLDADVITAKSVDTASRRITYAASVEAVDRMGDLIRQDGWETDGHAAAGGPFFMNHLTQEPPIGAVLGYKIGKAPALGGKAAKALTTPVQYLDKDTPMVGELSDLAWRMASGEGMPNGRPVAKGVSVGFLDKKSRRPDEKEALELGMPRYGLIFEGQELLELSQAPVPANPYALPVEFAKSFEVSALSALERETRAEIEDAWEHLVSEGHVRRSTVEKFRETYGVTGAHRLELARAKVKAFHDLGTWDLGNREEEADPWGDLFRSVTPDGGADGGDPEEPDEAEGAEAAAEGEGQEAEQEAPAAPEAEGEAPPAKEATFIGAALTESEVGQLREAAVHLERCIGALSAGLNAITDRLRFCKTTDPATIMSKLLADQAALNRRLDAQEGKAANPASKNAPRVTAAPPTPETTSDGLEPDEAKSILELVLGGR